MILFTSFSALWSIIFYALSVAVSSLGKMWDILFLNILWSAILLALGWKWSGAHGSMRIAAAYFTSYLFLAMMTFPYSAWRFGFRFKGVLRMILFSLVTVAIAYAVTFHCSPLASSVLSGLLGSTLIWAEWNWMLDEESRHVILSSTQSVTLRFVRRQRKVGWSKLGPE